VPTAVAIKFRRWDDLLGGASPDEKTMPITAALWHFGRGLAYADKGDTAQASAEREKMIALAGQVPPDAMVGMVNKAHEVLKLAQLTLDGKMAAAQQQWPQSVQSLRDAAAVEDHLAYMEPPDWLSPTRESLGGVLLRSGDGAGAEKAFRQALDDCPRSGRALFGLWKSLEAQGKQYDADLVRRQFETAWKNADTKLTVEEL
jgi:Tfp pilus assembly protein PilF